MDSQPPQKLDYVTAAPASGKARPKYLVSRLISSYIGYAIVMVVLDFFIPKFEPVFRDFKTTLPAATRWLLEVSRLSVQHYLWIVLIPLPAIWSVVNFYIPEPKLRRRLRLIAFLFVAGFLIYTLVALFLPMSHLMQSLNNPKP